MKLNSRAFAPPSNLRTLTVRPKAARLACLLLALALAACSEAAPQPTAVVIVRPLATVVLSPTPNLEQLAATRAAASPTPAPPTNTPVPSPTHYVGVFIGEAESRPGFQSFAEPLFAPNVVSARPTADARRCGRPIDERFLSIWQQESVVSQRLGCPIQESFGFFGRLQLFERGVMYLQPDIRAVWAIAPQGSLGRFYYVEAPPPLTGELPVSPRGLTPTGDFGSVWAMVAELPTRLGYGIAPEQEAAITLQRFDGGTFLLDASSGQVFALAVDGAAYGPFNVSVPGGAAPLFGATPTAIIIDGP